MGADDSGREPITIVEIDQNICENTFGVFPCTAELAPGEFKCFGTYATCLDPGNFNKDDPLTLSFCKPGVVLPTPASGPMIPSLIGVDTTPTELNPGGSSRNSGPLGARATCQCKFKDLPFSDAKVDPYLLDRIRYGVGDWDGTEGKVFTDFTGWTESDPNGFWSIDPSYDVLTYNTGVYTGADSSYVQKTNIPVEDSFCFILDFAVAGMPVGEWPDVIVASGERAEIHYYLEFDANNYIDLKLVGGYSGLRDQTWVRVSKKVGGVLTTDYYSRLTEDNIARLLIQRNPAGMMRIWWEGDLGEWYWKPDPFTGSGFQANTLSKIRISASIIFNTNRQLIISFPQLMHSNGPYDPRERGTFWTKWLARNPYYNRWHLRVRDGYAGQAIAAMTTRQYVIEKIDGPDASGNVTVTANDMLDLADDTKAQCPIQSTGELSDAILETQSEADYVRINVIDPDEYGATGVVRIGDELMSYTTKSTSGSVVILTGVTRAAYNTELAAHAVGDLVQACYVADEVAAWAVVKELLEDYAGIDSTYVPYADWVTECTTYLASFTVSTVISEPVGVNTLVGELALQCGFDLWWDERDQEIKLRAVRLVTETPTELNERQHIIADSWSFTDDPKQRVSRVWVYFNPKNYVAGLDDTANYENAYIMVDVDLESSFKYGEPAVKKIFSRWLSTNGQAVLVASRYMARFQDGAQFLKIKCDAKDRDLWTGDIVTVELRSIVDAVGLPDIKTYQIIKAEETDPGTEIEFTLMLYDFINYKVAIWTEADEIDYDDPSFDPEAPPDGAWWAYDDGEMGDGREGWTWTW